MGFNTNSFALGLSLDFVATLLAADIGVLGNVEGDSDVEGAFCPELIERFETSGGRLETATVGVGGVLASDLALLASIDCLPATLATGTVELFPVDWDGENRFEFCCDGGASVPILASDGGDEPLEDEDGVGGDLEWILLPGPCCSGPCCEYGCE